MKSRVSSTVTKRKPNPRPRKYASASERQAAYRARAPEVCFRAEDKTVDTLDRIAADLDVSRADLLLSMTKFALTNHDWARFGLTHKPLPFGYGTQDETRKENPMKADIKPGDKGITSGYPATVIRRYSEGMIEVRVPGGVTVIPTQDFIPEGKMTKTTKRKPTPAQLAARERFAEMARSGAFKKAGGRKANPIGDLPKLTAKPTATRRVNPAMKKIVYESSPNRGNLKQYVVRDMEDRNGMGSDVAQFMSKSDAMKYARAYANKYKVQVSVRSV